MERGVRMGSNDDTFWEQVSAITYELFCIIV